jgi:hypothetical protein
MASATSGTLQLRSPTAEIRDYYYANHRERCFNDGMIACNVELRPNGL